MVKDADITVEEARGLVSNPVLWPRVRDFLWNFAPQVHESWLGSSVVRWLGGEESSPPPHHPTTPPLHHLTTPPPNHPTLSSPRVKRLVLESLGVEPCFHAFPKEDGSRLLLLDAATLESLVQWLGALACAEELRKITDGAAVKALKAALPGVYPEVFGYVAYFGNFDFRRKGAETPSLEDKIVQAGCELMSVALSGLPAALVSRLKLKFAKDSAFASLASRIASGAEDGRETLDARREKIRSHVFKLLKLKFPEAYLLCCS